MIREWQSELPHPKYFTIPLRSAAVLPHNKNSNSQLNLHEYWVVKIKEIRARDDDDVSGISSKHTSSPVFTIVTGLGTSAMVLFRRRSCQGCEILVSYLSSQTLRSSHNSSGLLPCGLAVSLHNHLSAAKCYFAQIETDMPVSDPLACGKYERLFSDHLDYVSSAAFDGLSPQTPCGERLNHTLQPLSLYTSIRKTIQNKLSLAKRSSTPAITLNTSFVQFVYVYFSSIIRPSNAI